MFSHFASMISKARREKVRCKPLWLEVLAQVKSYSTKCWIFTIGHETQTRLLIGSRWVSIKQSQAFHSQIGGGLICRCVLIWDQPLAGMLMIYSRLLRWQHWTRILDCCVLLWRGSIHWNDAFKNQYGYPKVWNSLSVGFIDTPAFTFLKLRANPATLWWSIGNNKNTTGNWSENLLHNKPAKLGHTSGNWKNVRSLALEPITMKPSIKSIFSTSYGVETVFLKLEIFHHMQGRGSEALRQSRALAHESSLTDLHIACELTASRDSGTDASQANAAFTAGSVAKQHGACSRASPASGGWIIPCCNTVGKTMFFKVAASVFSEFWCGPGGLLCTLCGAGARAVAPLLAGVCVLPRQQTSAWVGEGGWERHGTVREGVVGPPILDTVWNMLLSSLWAALHYMGRLFCFFLPGNNPNRQSAN